MKIVPTVRPYWHVDAKWMCGLLFVFTFGIGLGISLLSQATDGSRGPRLAALTVGTGFIRGNTIDTQDARKALAEHGGVITPLPNVPSISITEADLSLTPAEISIKVFKPITESIYLNGIDATADKYAPSVQSKEKFKKDASLLKLFTQQTHQQLSKLATIFMLLSCVLSIGVIYFSARWGRLANIGLLLIFTTFAGTFLGFAMSHPQSSANGSTVASAIQTEVGKILTQTYSKFMLLGILLLLIALVGHTYKAIRKPKQKPVLAKQ